MSTGRAAGADSDQARGECSPCRGTGKVISALNGSPHQVTCPWCGGTGRFQRDRNAQAAPADLGATDT